MTETLQRDDAEVAKRPWEISLLVIFGYIAGLFSLLTGTLIMLDRNDVVLQELSLNTKGQLVAFGMMLAVVGVAQIFIANMLAGGSEMMRILYAVIAVFNLAGGVWAMIALNSEQQLSGTFTATIALLVLWLLFNHRSAEFFENN